MAASTKSAGNAAKFFAPSWVWAAIAMVALLLAYARVWQADFNWDDDAHITANPTIIGPLGLKEIWTSGKANYFPLTMTSFWVQHALWGLLPAPYHGVTLLFHIAAALVLWRVLRQLRMPGAWLGAMVWALHPVQVESAAWICELKNTQSGFFFLLAVWFFLRWMTDPGPVRFRREYALALVAAVLAILSKSSTVMLPVVLGLLGWWHGHRRWRDARWLAPFFTISVLASGWTIWEQKVNSMAAGPDWSHGLASRLMIAGKVPWFYLGKLLWPEPLVFIYPRWDVNALGLVHWIPLAATVAFGGALWWWRNGPAQPVFLALTYFFVSLFPVLGLFDVFFFKYSFVGDHFQYLASMGPLALVGAGIVTVAQRFHERAGTLQGAAAALLLGALALLTWKQVGIYRTRETLWRDTVELNPNAWIAQMNLGSEYMTTGRSPLAIAHFQAALRLKPDDALARANLGSVYLQVGRPKEALPYLQQAVKLMPKLAEAHNSLGIALRELGRPAEAIASFETALKLNPSFALARGNLGSCLNSVQRYSDALEQFRAALKLQPSARDHLGAAQALTSLGRQTEAVEHYAAAVQLSPDSFDARKGLAELLAQMGAHAQALEHGLAAIRLQPGWAEGHFLVGNALLLSGRAAEAVPYYEQALRIRPEFDDARTNLGAALFHAGRSADAVPHYATVAQHRPDSAGAHNNLASALMQAGRLPEAIEHFQKAVSLENNYLEARRNLALALDAAGQRSEAMQQYEEILRLKPDDKAAQEQLQRLRSGVR